MKRVGCCLATKSFNLEMKWVEVIMGVAGHGLLGVTFS